LARNERKRKDRAAENDQCKEIEAVYISRPEAGCGQLTSRYIHIGIGLVESTKRQGFVLLCALSLVYLYSIAWSFISIGIDTPSETLGRYNRPAGEVGGVRPVCAMRAM
jgi:hypothetical protein